MNNKKTSAIKFSKRPVWQILFAAMIASGLMAVGQGTEEIEGKLAREVSELVKDAAIEVMEEQREVIEEKGGEIVQSRLIKAIEAQIMGELSIGKLFSIEFNNLTLEQTMEELERIRRAESELEGTRMAELIRRSAEIRAKLIIKTAESEKRIAESEKRIAEMTAELEEIRAKAEIRRTERIRVLQLIASIIARRA